MAVIGLVLVIIVTLIAAFGILRLGIVPHSEEVVRLIAWIGVDVPVRGLWLAFGLLLSVRRPAGGDRGAVGFGVWFSWRSSATDHDGAVRRVPTGPTRPPTPSRATQLQQFVAGSSRAGCTTRSPRSSSIRSEAEDISTPTTIGQYIQGQQQDRVRTAVDRPEPAPGLAADRRPRRADRRLLRRRLRRLHAPGGPRLGSCPGDGRPQGRPCVRCALRSSLTHLQVRSLRCSGAPSPERPCGRHAMGELRRQPSRMTTPMISSP